MLKWFWTFKCYSEFKHSSWNKPPRSDTASAVRHLAVGVGDAEVSDEPEDGDGRDGGDGIEESGVRERPEVIEAVVTVVGRDVAGRFERRGRVVCNFFGKYNYTWAGSKILGIGWEYLIIVRGEVNRI